MVCMEGAKGICAQELKELVEEQMTNPTVERLMFIETKKGGKIFPCWIEAWRYEDMKPVERYTGVVFLVSIAQSTSGQFGMVRVQIRESELGTDKRIWDKPPKKGLREETPWLENPTAEVAVQ